MAREITHIATQLDSDSPEYGWPPHGAAASSVAAPGESVPEGHGKAINASPSPAGSASRNTLRSRLILAAKVVIAGALLSWLIISGRLNLDELFSISLSWNLCLLVTLVFLSMVLPALRWWWLLRVQQIDEPLWRVGVLTWIGYFTAIILPGAASGDVARSCLVLRQRQDAKARAFSTVLADRFLGLYTLLLLGVLSLVPSAQAENGTRPMQAIISGTLALFLVANLSVALLVVRPCQTRLLGILPSEWGNAWNESFELYRTNKLSMLACFCLSVMSNVFGIAAFAVAAGLLGEAVSWLEAFLAGPAIVIANCLPITPGGVGVAEAVSSELFHGFGCTSGAEMMVLVRVCIVALSLPGVVGILVAGDARDRILSGQMHKPLRSVSNLGSDPPE